MKRRSYVAFLGAALVAPALLSLPALGADASAPYEVMSPGQVSCASWTQGRDAAGRDDVVFLTQRGIERAEREGWVSGYLSALNIEILPNDRGVRRDLTEAIDRNALMASIDDYCLLNPLHSLLSATATVSLALANEWLAAHPPGAASGAVNPRLPTAGLPSAEVPASADEEVPASVEEELPPSAAEIPLSELRPEPLPDAQTVAQPEPQPEPLPPSPGPTLAPAPTSPTNPVLAAPMPVLPAQPPTPPTPAASDSPAPEAPSEPALAPAAPAPAPSSPTPPPPATFAPPSSPVPELRSVVAAVTGGALLQIGAYRTDALAEQAWQAFLAEHVDIVSGLATDVQMVDLGARGVWHRLRIGPFSSSDAASTTCDSLKARGADCFTVLP